MKQSLGLSVVGMFVADVDYMEYLAAPLKTIKLIMLFAGVSLIAPFFANASEVQSCEGLFQRSVEFKQDFLTDKNMRKEFTSAEKEIVRKKLTTLPVTSSWMFSLLYPASKGKQLKLPFKAELEGILKSTLIQGKTQVNHLTHSIRNQLAIDRWVAAFHHQSSMKLKIKDSRLGSFGGPKQNESIRKLKHDVLLTETHNVYVEDGPVTFDRNPLSLLFHELSHAAFDEWIINNPKSMEMFLISWIGEEKTKKLFVVTEESLEIDGDLYDLLSERYAFELEYRLNRQITAVNPDWPFSFSFTEAPTENYVQLIEDYVRRHYDIDNPLLNNAKITPLDYLLK